MNDFQGAPPRREPVLNLPASTAWLLGILVGVQAVRSFLPPDLDDTLLLWFAFVPARYAEGGEAYPGGAAGGAWSFLTYALLHGDWTHLLVNAVWLAAFGSGLARRFGGRRFLLFSAACAVAGAGAHLLAHAGEGVPMVGASAAISGQMAAAARYAFGPPAGQRGHPAFRAPALSLGRTLADPRILAFLGVWFALNLVFGSGLVMLEPDQPDIAWEAHVGGFLFGLFAFSLFDPIGPRAARAPPA